MHSWEWFPAEEAVMDRALRLPDGRRMMVADVGDPHGVASQGFHPADRGPDPPAPTGCTAPKRPEVDNSPDRSSPGPIVRRCRGRPRLDDLQASLARPDTILRGAESAISHPMQVGVGHATLPVLVTRPMHAGTASRLRAGRCVNQVDLCGPQLVLAQAPGACACGYGQVRLLACGSRRGRALMAAGPGRNGAAVQVRSTAASSSRLVTPSLP
jgi:hypothetical protein